MKIIDIKNYEPVCSDVFLFDSNIWVYLFDTVCNIPEYWEMKSIKNYSNFFKKVISNKAKIYISSFNIQELTKKFIKHDRAAYEALYGDDKNYKDGYRASLAYSNTLEHIKNINNEILEVAIPMNDQFEKFESSLFFNKDIDFVDEYLCFLSDKFNCKFVTHDKDFKYCKFDIEILTDNKNLLKK